MKKTGKLLLAWATISVLFLLAVEAITLGDSTPMNHITAVVQKAFYAEPGVFVWLAYSLGFLSGHFFWGKRD